ncbi:hypothetical protein H0H93_014528 [Arthromyces matolae]|nr:hypothetical protein H0H93_014528 [Arthromyces matolae]
MSSTVDLHDPNSSAFKKARRLYHKATKNRNPDLELDWSPFRAAEKKYKARFPPPDLSNVLDLATLDPSREDEIRQGVWRGSTAVHYIELSATNLSTPKVYSVPEIPGLVILPSFVSVEKQRELVRWSLCDQARENETNLDVHYDLPPEGLWNEYLQSRRNPTKDLLVKPKASVKGSPATSEPSGPRKLVNNTPATLQNFSAISTTPKPPQTPSATVKPASLSDLVLRLRWANIGWFYHWGTKQYDFAKGQGHIDSRLRELCREAVTAVDWKQVYGNYSSDWTEWATWNESYGGLTRDSAPVPILLRSGDVVIMSGPECRRAYHGKGLYIYMYLRHVSRGSLGVPRILDNTLPFYLNQDDEDWEPYKDYLSTTRININVRQVFPKGFQPELVNS